MIFLLMDEKKKEVSEDSKIDKNQMNSDFDLVKILQESQKKNNKNTDIKQHDDGDKINVNNDKSTKIVANKLPKIERKIEKRQDDERKEDVEREIRENIEKENALKIQQQQDHEEKMREMQKWIQKCNRMHLKRKSKKKLKKKMMQKEMAIILIV